MPAAQKIVESGLRPTPKPALDNTLRAATQTMSDAIHAEVSRVFAAIKAAEEDAIARLNEFTPTESLMSLKTCAAYLDIPKRTLEQLTSPKVLEVPFVWVGGQKRFIKASVDSYLRDRETKRKGVKL